MINFPKNQNSLKRLALHFSKALLILIVLLGVYNIQAQDQVIHRIYLIGDAGEPFENPVLTLLKKEVEKVGDEATVVFLGDNIYPKGLPPKGHPLRGQAETAINGQIETVKSFDGNTIFIPGNHDWARGGKEGLQWLSIQEQYVEAALDSSDVWLPSRGCPGPVEVPVNDKITVIVMDTQWFLQKENKPFPCPNRALLEPKGQPPLNSVVLSCRR